MVSCGGVTYSGHQFWYFIHNSKGTKPFYFMKPKGIVLGQISLLL